MTDVLERADAPPGSLGDAKSKLRVIDCDIHPSLHTRADLYPFMTKRWQQHLETYGGHLRTPFTSTTPYPRSAPLLARRDAWPPTGGPPGSDLAFMRQQHLDPINVEFGILQVLDMLVFSQQNLELGMALQRAINEWQIECWSKPEPRLKASIVVGQDNAEAAVAEIERCAATGKYVQVNISPRANEPLGRRRYWPLYAAAQAANLPIGIHVGGYGGHAPTGGGWPSYYNEEHHSNAHSVAGQLTSLVIEGVPEQFPRLKFVFIEGGFGWVPAITWRMDQHWQRFRDEVPHVKRPPSEYVRERFWFTTQPVEEPDNSRHLRAVMEWIGIDRLLFSSDYPHWDYDDARFAFKTPLSDSERAKVFNANARTVYQLG